MTQQLPHQPQGPWQGGHHPQQPQGQGPNNPQMMQPEGQPGPQQWNQAQPGAWQDPSFQPDTAQARKNRRGTAIVAGALALLLVVGGGFLAFNFLGRGAVAEAARYLPADVDAMIEINLAPSMSDQLEVKEFAEKFPALRGDSEKLGNDYKAALWSFVEQVGGEETPAYSEVEPWLGDFVAVGVFFPEDAGQPWSVVAVDVSDEDKAREFFEREMGEHTHVSVGDGTVLLSDHDHPVDVESAQDNSLADTEMFKADMARLEVNALATMWIGPDADIRMSGAAGRVYDDPFDPTATPSDSPTTPDASELPEFHGAMGFDIEDGTAVIQGVVSSAEMTAHHNEDVTSLVADLPASDLVMGIAISDATYDELWKQLDQAPDVKEQLASAGITSLDDLKAVFGRRLALAADYGATAMGDRMPVMGIAVETENPAKHTEVVSQLVQTFDSQAELQHEVIDGTAFTTLGMSPAEMADPASTAGDNEVYDTVVASDDADQVVFVDVAGLLDAFRDAFGADDQMLQNVEPITGLGVTSSAVDGEYTDVRVRVGTK